MFVCVGHTTNRVETLWPCRVLVHFGQWNPHSLRVSSSSRCHRDVSLEQKHTERMWVERQCFLLSLSCCENCSIRQSLLCFVKLLYVRVLIEFRKIPTTFVENLSRCRFPFVSVSVSLCIMTWWLNLVPFPITAFLPPPQSSPSSLLCVESSRFSVREREWQKAASSVAVWCWWLWQCFDDVFVFYTHERFPLCDANQRW